MKKRCPERSAGSSGDGGRSARQWQTDNYMGAVSIRMDFQKSTQLADALAHSADADTGNPGRGNSFALLGGDALTLVSYSYPDFVAMVANSNSRSRAF